MGPKATHEVLLLSQPSREEITSGTSALGQGDLLLD